MNERLQELVEQTDSTIYDQLDSNALDPFVEKFAELIVRECAGVADDWYRNHDKIHSDPMSYVLAHFGVDK